MEWRAETGRDMLERIVMLLLALAALADHAASRSPATRRHVMWSFWQARAVATEFVTASAGSAASPPGAGSIHHGDDPADAMALAVSLRWLALVVLGMAARQRRLSRSHPDAVTAGPHDPSLDHHRQHLLRAVLSSVEPSDTS